MTKQYDGWAVKYSWGHIVPESIHSTRARVVKWWNKEVSVGGARWKWKNISRRVGHKIVKVKITEVE